MTNYIIFSVLILAFILAFTLLWKNRKNKNADTIHDPWKDIPSHTPDDNII